MRRRVLFTVRVLDSGGVVTHMGALASELIERGWEVAVASDGVVGDHRHGPEWFESLGVRSYQVRFLEPRWGLTSLARGLAGVGDLERVVRDFRPDLLHVHFRATSPYARLVQLLHGTPFVSTLHLDAIPSTGIFRYGTFWGARAVAISRETRSMLVDRFRVPAARVRVVHLGVDATHFRRPTSAERAAARAELGLDPAAPVVAVIGRLEPVKQHGLVLEALSRLHQSGQPATAIFAGEGKLTEKLRASASALGLGDHVIFPGHVDARTVLWSSDALALPSVKEGFPVAVVEAMLTGVVPVRTPTAGHEDQFDDGVEGFVVPFGDAGALADRLGQLLADDDLRSRMAGAAVERASARFDVRVMTDGIEAVYEEAIAERGATSGPARSAMFVVTGPGTTMFLRGQLEHLDRSGIRCTVVSAPGPQVESFRAAGIAVESAPLQRDPSPITDLRATVRLLRLVRRHRPALVNASTPKAGLLGMVAAYAARVPVRVYQCRGLRFETMTGRSRRLYKAIERLCGRLATHVLFNSESSRTTAIAEGVVSEAKAHVVGKGSSNGVDTDRFRPDGDARSATRERLGIPPDAPVIGFIGRLVREKGIEALVDTFVALGDEHPELRLVLTGNLEEGDPVPGSVRRTIERHDRIVLTGFVDDVAPLYAAMDVFVLPSWREGLPNAVLEAQAAGVPVVAYAATGTVDAVADGVGGRLVPVGDVDALRSAIGALLADPADRASVGAAGRRWVVERFDRKLVWDGLASAYAGWLAAAGSR